MAERRYREDEVREIFGLATSGKEVGPAATSAASGLTLADIQSIGLEVGLQPDVVARAAATLDNRGTRDLRKSLGMPIEVARTVSLPRALSDHEWEQLVAELRATFRTHGRVAAHGNLREWSNGNLHAYVEPTESGYRLRLGTLKGDAAGVNALGATGIGAGAMVFASLAISGGLQDGFFVPWVFGAAGVAAFVTNFVRLPRWARQRDRQMSHIADVVRALVGEKTPTDSR